MTLQDLRNQINELPKRINSSDYSFAGKYLEELKEKFIESVKTFSLDIEGKKEFQHFEKFPDRSEDKIKEFVSNLDETICRFNEKCLQCLKPDSKARDFDDFVELFFKDNKKCLYEKSMITTITSGTDFYRVRATDKKNQYKLFRHKEMYMLAPSLSAKVSTARFNLSGFACLYLAESLYLAWEECRQPDFHTTNFVRFRNKKDLKVLNLTIPEVSRLKSIGAFFMSYLSLVCSAKANDDDKDHWQYRISNLFIKMIYQLEEKYVDGIKYMSSKRFENENFRLEYTKDCAAYVFIPKSVDEEYCKKLASFFDMTDSHSYFYFKMYGKNYVSTSEAATRDYDNTIFAYLEKQLKMEKTTPCIKIIE